jgi:hypothetical protein
MESLPGMLSWHINVVPQEFGAGRRKRLLRLGLKWYESKMVRQVVFGKGLFKSRARIVPRLVQTPRGFISRDFYEILCLDISFSWIGRVRAIR